MAINKSIRWYHKIWRFFFWYFIIAVPFYIVSQFGKEIQSDDFFGSLGFVLGMVTWPFITFYFGYYRPHKRGISAKPKKQFAWLLAIITVSFIILVLPISIQKYKEMTCKPPKELLGMRCCIPSKIILSSVKTMKANW